MEETVTLTIELPKSLAEVITQHQASHPEWTDYRMAIAAYSLFLMQNGFKNKAISRLYLDSLFDFGFHLYERGI